MAEGGGLARGNVEGPVGFGGATDSHHDTACGFSQAVVGDHGHIAGTYRGHLEVNDPESLTMHVGMLVDPHHDQVRLLRELPQHRRRFPEEGHGVDGGTGQACAYPVRLDLEHVGGGVHDSGQDAGGGRQPILRYAIRQHEIGSEPARTLHGPVNGRPGRFAAVASNHDHIMHLHPLSGFRGIRVPTGGFLGLGSRSQDAQARARPTPVRA